MSEKTIAFIGTGSMNGAIASGLLASGYRADKVRATVASSASAKKLAQSLENDQVQIFSSAEDAQANQKAVEGADLVVLGVKPYALVSLAQELAPFLEPDALVISVAAGIDLATLQQAVGQKQPVIRCMPNTPSRLGKGVLAFSVGQTVSQSQRELAETVLGAVGQTVQVEEQQMDAVTALSGSGPAYAFLLAETMAAAGEKLGLDSETAQKLAAATLAGAGYLLEADPHPAELRKAVTSPGGTTEQAIAAFEKGGLAELTLQAMQACAEKSAQMSKEYSK